MSMSEK